MRRAGKDVPQLLFERVALGRRTLLQALKGGIVEAGDRDLNHVGYPSAVAPPLYRLRTAAQSYVVGRPNGRRRGAFNPRSRRPAAVQLPASGMAALRKTLARRPRPCLSSVARIRQPIMPLADIAPQLRAVGALPAPVRGALWMVGATTAIAAMITLVRLLSAEFDPLQIVFFRTAFGLIAMLPWLAGRGFGALRTQRLGLHVLRAAIGLVAMVLWFTTLTLLPLAEATALSFTAPVFTSVLAVLVLGEVMRLRRWTATAIGFLGALIILRPGVEALDPAALLAVVTAAVWATSSIVVKVLARTDQPAAIATYMTLLLTPLSLVPALFVWRTPGLDDLALCVLLGAAGSIGHVCMARALAAADATVVMPFDYLRLPLVAVFAYALFGEVASVWTWAGGAVIAGSSVYIAQREARLKRPRPPAPAAPGAG